MRLSRLLMISMVALLTSPTFGNPGPPPPPPVLYAVCSESDCLYVIHSDEFPSVVEEIGELGPPGRFSACTSMAVDWDGNVYTVNNTTGELLSLNKVNGEATVVVTGVGEQDGLAFSPVDLPGPGGTTIPAGTLFGSTDQLVTIDRTTGNVTVIGPIGRRIAGLAFRAEREGGATLFGAEAGGHNRLVTISTETATETVVGTIGPGVNRLGALAFHCSGGGRGGFGCMFWGSDAETGTVFAINAETGEASYPIELPSGYRAEGMGFAHLPVPVEPTTWGAIKSHYR